MATLPLPFYPSYADLRSPALTHIRSKKYPTRRPRKRNTCCEICCPPKHGRRLSRRVEAKWEINGRGWHDIWAAESEHEGDMMSMDDVILYERFGKGGEFIERGMAGGDGWVRDEEGMGMIVDEEWPEWAVRARAKEGMLVKEETDVRATATTVKNGVQTSTASPSDPSIPSILSNILVPEKYRIRYCRRDSIPDYTSFIAAFASLGDFTWEWHRNGSGCWILGYPLSCRGCSFPCSCCCVGNGSMYYACSCEEFEGLPAPEDQQRCSLVEWVRGELWGIMVREEWARMLEGTLPESLVGEEWEVMSRGVSEGWSVVSSEEEFEVLDLDA
ncbi:hypothetical protein IQ07DRAFT_638619 [Pyrenochaeta sp. DS3sAY3a]|nr:hypothetical protein IQ07DRAFT_638619 [Pyrenochaeta sp. DS3sAY3a]